MSERENDSFKCIDLSYETSSRGLKEFDLNDVMTLEHVPKIAFLMKCGWKAQFDDRMGLNNRIENV